jgi:hypothetical protein
MKMATKTAMLMRRRMRIMTMIMKTAMMNGMKNTKTMTSTMMMKTTRTTKTMRKTEEAEMAVAETDSATIRVDSPPEAHAAAHEAVPQVVAVQAAVHLAAVHEVEDVAAPVMDVVPRKVIHSLETNILQVEVVPAQEEDHPAVAEEAVHPAVADEEVQEEVPQVAAHEVEAVAVPAMEEALRKVTHSLETNILRVEAVPVHVAVRQAVVAVRVLPVDREAVLQAVHGVLPVADEVATADNEIARVDLPPTAEVLVVVPAEEAVSAAVADVILN